MFSFSNPRRDESQKAMVLYDPHGQKLSLVNDPLLWNQFYGDENSAGHISSHRRSNASVCPHCGQYLPTSDQPRPLKLDGGISRVSGVNTPTTNGSGSSTVRDMDYFKLLEYVERARDSLSTQTFEYDGDDDDNITSPKTNGISKNALSQGYFDRFFVTRGLLGRGSRGAVYLVEHVLDGVSLGMFAVKKVAVGNDHVWLEKVLSEVQMLRMLTHSNLVGYNHVWLENSRLSQFGPEVPCAYILQEYCDGGTLEDYLKSRQATVDNVDTSDKYISKRERLRRLSSTQYNNECGNISTKTNESTKRSLGGKNSGQLNHLSKTEIVSFMIDITRGVAHLHQNQIIHRDLKPSNCLLVNSKMAGDLPSVLVSDFGEGQFEGLHRSATGSTGTLEYCAPELVRADLDGSLAEFSKSTDIFSLGMIMYLLCFSQLPYTKTWWEERQDIDKLVEEVRNYQGFDEKELLSMRSDLPSNIYQLLFITLSIDPLQRPSAEYILEVLRGEEASTSNDKEQNQDQDQYHNQDQNQQSLYHGSVSKEVDSVNGSDLVPVSAIWSAVRYAPPSSLLHPILSPVRYLNQRKQLLALKIVLLSAQVISTYKLGLNMSSNQILVLLIGFGIPL